MIRRRRSNHHHGGYHNSHYNSHYAYHHHDSWLLWTLKNSKYTLILCLVLIVCFILQFITNTVNINDVVLDTQEVVNFNFISTFTSLFFHVSFTHFFFNLVALFIFSRKGESELHSGVILLFVLGGILANVIASFYAGFLDSHYIGVGASAAVAPLIFFTILAKPISLLTPFAWFIILYDIVNLSNLNTTTNHTVHVTGYIATLLLITILRFRSKQYIYHSIAFNLIGLIALYYGLSYYYW